MLCWQAQCGSLIFVVRINCEISAYESLFEAYGQAAEGAVDPTHLICVLLCLSFPNLWSCSYMFTGYSKGGYKDLCKAELLASKLPLSRMSRLVRGVCIWCFAFDVHMGQSKAPKSFWIVDCTNCTLQCCQTMMLVNMLRWLMGKAESRGPASTTMEACSNHLHRLCWTGKNVWMSWQHYWSKIVKFYCLWRLEVFTMSAMRSRRLIILFANRHRA